MDNLEGKFSQKTNEKTLSWVFPKDAQDSDFLLVFWEDWGHHRLFLGRSALRFFVCFLGALKPPKIYIEIIWPLIEQLDCPVKKEIQDDFNANHSKNSFVNKSKTSTGLKFFQKGPLCHETEQKYSVNNLLPGFLPPLSPKLKKSRMLKRKISPEREENDSKKPKLEKPMKNSQNIQPSNSSKQNEMEGKEEGEISDSDEDISTKGIETSILLLIDQVAAVFFVN